MPKITRVETLDDIEYGKGNEVPATETRIFMVRGCEYETCLSAENAAQFDADMLHWTEYAMQLPGQSAPRTRTATTRARRPKGDDASARMREWAREQGIKVSDRGRLPLEVEQAYTAAHAGLAS